MYNRSLPQGATDFRDEDDAPRTEVRTKRRIRGFTLSEEAYAGLKMLAQIHNDHPGFGHQNSVSDLLERIGFFELMVLDPKQTPKLAGKRDVKQDMIEALIERSKDATTDK